MLNLTKNYLVASLVVATSAFAMQSKTQASPSSEQGHEMSSSQMMAIYNAPAAIDVRNSWDLYTSGTFIYWQAREENLELALISRNDAEGTAGTGGDTPFNTSYVNNMNVTNPHFTYRPGFKLGLGANLDYDNWDAFGEYTWFHSTISTGVSPVSKDKSVTIPPDGEYLYPIQGAAGAAGADELSGSYPLFFISANQNWVLKMDFADVSLARSYYLGTKVTLRPYIGARGAWIRQKLNTSLYGSNTYSEPHAGVPQGNTNSFVHQSSASWGVGPRGGLESNWLLGYGTRLIGNAAADILYTRYSLRMNQQVADLAFLESLSPIQTNAAVYQTVDYLRAHTELELGFGWGTYFWNNKWHVDLNATYGFQVFWDQNMFRNFDIGSSMQAKSFAPNGNLFVHGLTFSTMFDF